MAIPNPYVGPRPFSQDQPLFGRDREVQELRGLITSERIVLLYSPSGAGKSSLVNAGLIPQLKKRFDIWGPTRVNTEAPSGVKNRFVWSAIAGLAGTDLTEDVRLAEYAAKRPRQRNPLIIIDQFEEILRVDPLDSEPKREFFTQLGEMLSVPSIWALLVLREDYLAPLDPYARLIPTHLQNRYRLDRLTREGAEHAIGRPVENCPRRYANGVVEELAKNLATVKVTALDGKTEEKVGEYVEPLQLQVVCFDLWSRMERDQPEKLVIEQDDIGDVSGALRSYYDNAVQTAASLSGYDVARERAIREWFKFRLITPDGVRNQVRHEPVRSGGLENEAIRYLLDTYLVRAEPRGSSIWYELAHDRLVAPVQESNAAWLDAHLNKLQRTAQLWISEGRKAALLLTGEELESALAEARGIRLQPEEEEFVAASRELQVEAERKAQAALREKEQAERIRKTNIFLRVAFALALVAVVVALWERNTATKDEKKALDSQDLAQQEAKAASGAAGEAREQRGKALLAAEAASGAAAKAQLEATHAQQALNGTNSAMTRLFAEKAKSYDALADSSNTADNSQNAWMFALAALDRAHDGGPDAAEAAGLLLRPDFYPAYKDAPEEKILTAAQLTQNRIEHLVLRPGTGQLLYTVPAVMGGAADAASRIVCYNRPARAPQPGQPQASASPVCPNSNGLPGASLAGHVDSAAVDSSGRNVAVGYRNLQVRTYPPMGIAFRQSDQNAAKFYETAGPVESLAFGQNYLVAGTSAGHLLLFRVGTQGLEKLGDSACPQKVTQCPALLALAWSSDPDPLLAAGYDDASVHFYRIASDKSGKPGLKEAAPGWTAPAAGITSIAFWPGTALIVIGHSDGMLRVLDRPTGKLRAASPLHETAVLAMSFEEEAHTLVNVSADGDLHRTALSPNVFGTPWNLKTLFSGPSGRDLRREFLRKSAIELGYGDVGTGLVDDAKLKLTDRARAAGKQFFGIDEVKEPHFMKGDDLLIRPTGPDIATAYPNITGNVIGLMPDQVHAARSVVMHKQDLKGAFKAEFEYRMRSPGASPYQLGDGFVFMFYKDRTPYETGVVKTPIFGFEFGTGYGVVFNSYYGRIPGGTGVLFYDPSTPDDTHPRSHVSLNLAQVNSSSATDWKKVCIEVNPGLTTIKPLCSDDKSENFLGMRTYLNGVPMNLGQSPAAAPGPAAAQMAADFGGFGFASQTGDAVEEQTIRNVNITHAGSTAPDQNLQFRNDNTVRLVRVGNTAPEAITITSPTYPIVGPDRVTMTGDNTFRQSTVVMLSALKTPRTNYALEFEYSVRSASPIFSTSNPPNALVAWFGKDTKSLESSAPSALPADPSNSGSFGVRFNTSTRNIELLDNLGRSKIGVVDIPANSVYSAGQPRRVRIEVNRTAGTVRVLYQGNEVINQSIDMSNMTGSIGFGATTGTEASGSTGTWTVSKVTVSELKVRKHHN